MKFQFMFSALLCTSLSLSGQVQIGAKAFVAPNMTQASSKEYADLYANKLYDISYEKSQPRKGIGLSLYAQSDLLFFMTDALYTNSSRQFALLSTNFQRTSLDPPLKMQAAQNDLRLVVNSGVKLGNIKLGVGPEIALTMNSEEDLSKIEGIEKSDTKYNTGFNFLIGYMVNKHIHVDLRHTYIFQDVSNEYTFQGIPMDMRKNAKYLELSLAAYF